MPTPEDIARARREALAPFLAAELVAMDAQAFEKLLRHPEALVAFWGEPGEDDEEEPYEVKDGVAVVAVRGALSQRGGRFWLWSWAGYDTLLDAVTRACADDRVRAVMLDIDSPGGVVAGCFDAARAMRAAVEASGKPCVAVASEMACSAAYALACVGDELVVPETGLVGSIGVMGTMTSLARMYAELGVDQRVIASGGAKGDGHPALPISKEALARAQERIDATAAVFAGWVSERRGMTADAVMALDARVLAGPAAVAAGLADRVSSSADALRALQKRVAPPTTDPQRPLGASPAAGAATHTQRHTMHPILAALGVTTDAEGLQAATSLLSLRAQVRAVTGAADDAAALGALHAMKRDAESANALRAQIEADRKASAAKERAAILDGAVAAMKLSPAERAADGTAEGWTTALTNDALRAFVARAGAAPAPRVAQPASVAARATAAALTDEQRALADQLGLSHDDYAKALAAQG